MQISRRAVWLALVALLLAGAALAYDQWRRSTEISAGGAAAGNVPPISRMQFPATRQGWLDQLADADRLPPDTRFLSAFQAIDRLLGDKGDTPIAAHFSAGQWRVTRGAVTIARLPEYPDFAEWLGQITTYAQQALARPGLALKEGALEDEADIMALLKDGRDIRVAEAADRLGKHWRDGDHKRQALLLASHALALLHFQLADDARVAQSLPAQSLAVLAAARAAGLNVVQDEALLAHALGYTAHARRLADGADVDPVLAVYSRKDAVSTARLAEKPDATHLSRLCNLYLAGERGTPQVWNAALQLWSRGAGAASLAWGKSASGPASPLDRWASSVLPFETVRVLEQVVGDGKSAPLPNKAGQPEWAALIEAELLRLFPVTEGRLATALDASVARLKQRYVGAFLPGAVYADYFESHFYSSVYNHGLAALDFYADPSQGERLLRRMGQSPDARQTAFRNWYAIVLEAGQHELKPEDFERTLKTALTFSPAAALRVMVDQKETPVFGSAHLVASAHQLLRALDARPEYRAAHARMMYELMLDVPAADESARAAIAQDPEGQGALIVDRARWMRDNSALKDMVVDKSLQDAVRVRAARVAHDLKVLSDAEYADTLAVLYADSPDPQDFITSYGRALIDAGRYPVARRVLRAWLARHGRLPGLLPVEVRMLLARACRLQGRLDEALTEATDAAESGMASSVAELMRVEEALGHTDKALALARQNMERYPRVLWIRIELARLYWLAGESVRAAEVFGRGAPVYAELAWRDEVGPAMVKVFAQRDSAAVDQAVQALIGQGVDHAALRGLAHAFGNRDHSRAAASILSQLRFPGLGQFSLVAAQYQYEKRMIGDAAALAWLESKIPITAREPFMMIAYQQAPELLWSLNTGEKPGSGHEYVWLLRAYSAALAHDAERLQSAKAFFTAQGNDYYAQLGRHATGQLGDEAVLSQITSPKQACEVVYALAMKALAEGRKSEAIKLLRTVVETLSSRDGEYHWAYAQLYRWRDEGGSGQWRIGVDAY